MISFINEQGDKKQFFRQPRGVVANPHFFVEVDEILVSLLMRV